MPNPASSAPNEFTWQPQPDTWRWLLDTIIGVCAVDPFCQSLRQRLLQETGTRLVDWLDHVAVTPHLVNDAKLACLGFEACKSNRSNQTDCNDADVWTHPHGLFPKLVRRDPEAGQPETTLGLKVDSIDDFIQAHFGDNDDHAEIQGDAAGSLRFAKLNDGSITLVERRGNTGWTVAPLADETHSAVSETLRSFRQRSRPRVDYHKGFDDAASRFREASERLGIDWACELFFQAEREYWQSRNEAARVQYRRQQALGMGWANHDHHTYRSSRGAFANLVALLEEMGFQCRERFYAGSEAGWGAQVLEQPECGIVVFADVDLADGEVEGDFAHEGLAERDEFGTVGMWCQLHGEAMLSAGMHHLECQFDFDQARSQLAAEGIESMQPFTDFPHLKQAFTEGETWSVDQEQIEHLVRKGVLDAEQAQAFGTNGARGSHLEILERNDGYKGFNQSGISEIISRTDPRKA